MSRQNCIAPQEPWFVTCLDIGVRVVIGVHRSQASANAQRDRILNSHLAWCAPAVEPNPRFQPVQS